MSCGGQHRCDVLIEGVVELPPGGAEGRAAGEVAGEGAAEVGQGGGQDAAVGLGEQYGNRACGVSRYRWVPGSRSMMCFRRSRRRS